MILTNRDKCPIVICGAARSGTTALVSALNLNGIKVTNEWGLFAGVPENRSLKEFIAEKQYVINDSELAPWLQLFSGKKLLIDEGLFNLPYSKLIHYATGGDFWWGDKWTYEHHISSLLLNFPNAKIIYIHRDPRQVAISMIKAGMTNSLDEGIDNWCRSVRSWLSWRDSISHLTVLQADLAFNPSKVYEQMSQFLGIVLNDFDLIDEHSETRAEYFERLKDNSQWNLLFGKKDLPGEVLTLANQLGYVV